MAQRASERGREGGKRGAAAVVAILQSLNMGGARTARGDRGKARRRGRRLADNAITKRALLPPSSSLATCEENIPRAVPPPNQPSGRANSNADRPTDTHSHDVRDLPPFLPLCLPSVAHSLTHFIPRSLARFFCPRPCYYGNGGVVASAARKGYFREGRIENRGQSTFCCTHYFFGLPSPPLPSSLPPTHLPNRIMQRRKDGGAAGNT